MYCTYFKMDPLTEGLFINNKTHHPVLYFLLFWQSSDTTLKLQRSHGLKDDPPNKTVVLTKLTMRHHTISETIGVHNDTNTKWFLNRQECYY